MYAGDTWYGADVAARLGTGIEAPGEQQFANTCAAGKIKRNSDLAASRLEDLPQLAQHGYRVAIAQYIFIYGQA